MKSSPPSCTVCAKAKSRCVRLPDQDACDRCTRLRKVCVTKEQSTIKRKSHKVTKTQQLQKLEQKLESLADALIPKQGQHDEATLRQPAQPTSTGTVSVEEPSVDLGTQYSHKTPEIVLGSSQTISQDTMSDSILFSANLSRCEVENLIDRYKMLMAPHMPFISQRALPIIASSDASPLLLKAVVAVAYFHDTSMQKILVNEVLHYVTSRVFTSSEKSLDILQALLVLGTWYNPHIFTSSSHTSLLHLCMALATDLAIDRDTLSCEMTHMVAALESCGIPQPAKTVSDEERRAVLGVFWLTSTVFTSFRKTDVPNWTPWLQQCLETLKKTGLESDEVLVGLVQRQKIMHQAMSTSLLYTPGALQIEIDDANLADVDTADNLTRTLLSLQRECAKIAIWEPSFLTHDLDGIWSCASSLTSYLTLYDSLPVSSYLTIPFTVFAQFAYVFVVMVRASSTYFDDFDGTLLRELIDFEKAMEQASEKYKAVARLKVDGARVRNSGFAEWAAKCRWAKIYHSMKAKEMYNETLQRGGTHTSGDPTLVDSVPGGTEWVESEGFSLEF